MKKPKVKLLTLWMLDDVYDIAYKKKVPDHTISNGIWEAQGVEIKLEQNGIDKYRVYSLVCVSSNHKDLAKGTIVKMREELIIELCHRVKIVSLPKYKSRKKDLPIGFVKLGALLKLEEEELKSNSK